MSKHIAIVLLFSYISLSWAITPSTSSSSSSSSESLSDNVSDNDGWETMSLASDEDFAQCIETQQRLTQNYWGDRLFESLWEPFNIKNSDQKDQMLARCDRCIIDLLGKIILNEPTDILAFTSVCDIQKQVISRGPALPETITPESFVSYQKRCSGNHKRYTRLEDVEADILDPSAKLEEFCEDMQLEAHNQLIYLLTCHINQEPVDRSELTYINDTIVNTTQLKALIATVRQGSRDGNIENPKHVHIVEQFTEALHALYYDIQEHNKG